MSDDWAIPIDDLHEIMDLLRRIAEALERGAVAQEQQTVGLMNLNETLMLLRLVVADSIVQ